VAAYTFSSRPPALGTLGTFAPLSPPPLPYSLMEATLHFFLTVAVSADDESATLFFPLRLHREMSVGSQ